MFAVTILGNNSAVPTNERYPTSQVVTYHDRLFMIDCGEGTQMQIARYKIRRSKIDHIFISHLHGDHYFGLIGLINSLSLIGRVNPLYIYGSPQLKEIIDLQLNCAATVLNFKIIFTPLLPESTGILLEGKDMRVHYFNTQHRIPCFGFLFEEIKNKRKILPDKARESGIPAAYFSQLQQGKDCINKEGELIKNELVTEPPTPARKYAYCADTLYDEQLIPHIYQSDLVYHETTYLQDQLHRATQRFHSTTLQAATIALKANVKKLIIGHFSSKYEDINSFEEECKTIFPNTELAVQGATFCI
jgi:ribonuclease Z